MLIPDLCQKSCVRITHPVNSSSHPPPDVDFCRPHPNTMALTAALLSEFIRELDSRVPYHSTTGTISSSGWFPTTWSMKSSFPLDLHVRMGANPQKIHSAVIQRHACPHLMCKITCLLTVWLRKGPWKEGDGNQAETIHCILSSPLMCAWCHHTVAHKRKSTILVFWTSRSGE